MGLNELASFEQRYMLFSNPFNRNRCETWSRSVPTAMTKLDLSQFYYYTVSETSILSCLPWNKRIVKQITVFWWVLTSWHLLNKEIFCFRTPSIGIDVKLYILACILYIYIYIWSRWVPTAMTKLDLSQFYYYTVSETSILSCLPWNKRIVKQITVFWWVLTSWHLLNKEICCFRTPLIGIEVKLYRDEFRRLWRSSIYRSFTIILWAKPVSWAVCLEINELSSKLLYFDGS